MEVVCEGVSKYFGTTEALAPLDLTVPDRKFLAMLGPSGCGKTTMLRLLAGLEQPSSGRILIGPEDVTRLEPRDRDVAMVFQSYALYPHMRVHANIAYPLKVRGVRGEAREEQVKEVAELLGLGSLLDRTPRQLSGGQRQRVALARAIIRNPKAFLMDEPLSNLDAQLRLQMRVELKRLQRDLGVTTIYVTHDQTEAMTMADLIAVLREGHLQQVGSPTDLYARPANLFVAQFCGSPPMNVLDGVIEDREFRHEAGAIPVADANGRGPAKLGFRPEHAELVEGGTPNALRGEIYVVEPLGNEVLVSVKIDDELLTVRMAAGFDRAVGAGCAVRPLDNRIHLFDAQNGESLARGADSPQEDLSDVVGVARAPDGRRER
jgi:multiple sugar transport system ATP-binding protein